MSAQVLDLLTFSSAASTKTTSPIPIAANASAAIQVWSDSTSVATVSIQAATRGTAPPVELVSYANPTATGKLFTVQVPPGGFLYVIFPTYTSGTVYVSITLYPYFPSTAGAGGAAASQAASVTPATPVEYTLLSGASGAISVEVPTPSEGTQLQIIVWAPGVGGATGTITAYSRISTDTTVPLIVALPTVTNPPQTVATDAVPVGQSAVGSPGLSVKMVGNITVGTISAKALLR